MLEYRETNLNYKIKVKLKPEAIEELRRQHDELYDSIGKPGLYPFNPPAVDEEGYSTFQLWSFMQDFGNTITLGRIPMFETGVKIEVETNA